MENLDSILQAVDELTSELRKMRLKSTVHICFSTAENQPAYLMIEAEKITDYNRGRIDGVMSPYKRLKYVIEATK